MIIRKNQNNTIELLEGGDDLPEGEAVRVWTAEELRRLLGLIPLPGKPSDPEDPEPLP